MNDPRTVNLICGLTCILPLLAVVAVAVVATVWPGRIERLVGVKRKGRGR